MALRRAVLVFPTALLVTIALALPAWAASGDLDHGFSGDGKVRISLKGATDVAIQPDGKTVIVGTTGSNWAIVRLKQDGTLDQTFSGDGIARISSEGDRTDTANAVVIRNGKIVVVGTSVRNDDNVSALAILRLNSNGTPDTTFSDDGAQLLRVGSTSQGIDVAIQSDGKIVAVGTSDHEFLVMRRLSNGDPDHSFSSDGSTRTPFPENVTAWSVAIDPTDGRILVGGAETNSGGFGHNFVVAAYTKSGDLDHSFSGDGKSIRPTALGGGLAALAVLDNGRIIAAGTTVKSGTGDQFLIEKYNRAGDFDPNFGGGDGVQVVGFGGGDRDDFASDVKVQEDGKIVVGGTSIGADKQFAVARLTAAGKLDSTFDGGGVLTAFTKNAGSSGLAINDGTHKIVLVGFELSSPPAESTTGMLAARYLG